MVEVEVDHINGETSLTFFRTMILQLIYLKTLVVDLTEV